MKTIYYLILIIFCLTSCDINKKSYEEYDNYTPTSVKHKTDNFMQYVNDLSDDYPNWEDYDMLKHIVFIEFENDMVDNPNFAKNFIEDSDVIRGYNKVIRRDKSYEIHVFMMNKLIELDNGKSYDLYYEVTSKIPKGNPMDRPYVENLNKLKKIEKTFVFKPTTFFMGSFEIIDN